jgi:hypothetical protein
VKDCAVAKRVGQWVWLPDRQAWVRMGYVRAVDFKTRVLYMLPDIDWLSLGDLDMQALERYFGDVALAEVINHDTVRVDHEGNA